MDLKYSDRSVSTSTSGPLKSKGSLDHSKQRDELRRMPLAEQTRLLAPQPTQNTQVPGSRPWDSLPSTARTAVHCGRAMSPAERAQLVLNRRASGEAILNQLSAVIDDVERDTSAASLVVIRRMTHRKGRPHAHEIAEELSQLSNQIDVGNYERFAQGVQKLENTLLEHVQHHREYLEALDAGAEMAESARKAIVVGSTLITIGGGGAIVQTIAKGGVSLLTREGLKHTAASGLRLWAASEVGENIDGGFKGLHEFYVNWQKNPLERVITALKSLKGIGHLLDTPGTGVSMDIEAHIPIFRKQGRSTTTSASSEIQLSVDGAFTAAVSDNMEWEVGLTGNVSIGGQGQWKDRTSGNTKALGAGVTYSISENEAHSSLFQALSSVICSTNKLGLNISQVDEASLKHLSLMPHPTGNIDFARSRTGDRKGTSIESSALGGAINGEWRGKNASTLSDAEISIEMSKDRKMISAAEGLAFEQTTTSKAGDLNLALFPQASPSLLPKLSKSRKPSAARAKRKALKRLGYPEGDRLDAMAPTPAATGILPPSSADLTPESTDAGVDVALDINHEVIEGDICLDNNGEYLSFSLNLGWSEEQTYDYQDIILKQAKPKLQPVLAKFGVTSLAGLGGKWFPTADLQTALDEAKALKKTHNIDASVGATIQLVMENGSYHRMYTRYFVNASVSQMTHTSNEQGGEHVSVGPQAGGTGRRKGGRKNLHADQDSRFGLAGQVTISLGESLGTKTLIYLKQRFMRNRLGGVSYYQNGETKSNQLTRVPWWKAFVARNLKDSKSAIYQMFVHHDAKAANAVAKSPWLKQKAAALTWLSKQEEGWYDELCARNDSGAWRWVHALHHMSAVERKKEVARKRAELQLSQPKQQPDAKTKGPHKGTPESRMFKHAALLWKGIGGDQDLFMAKQ